MVVGLNPFGGRATTFAGLILAALCLAYVMARSSAVPALFVVAQLLFLIPVFAAALLTLEAYRVGPPGDERKAWGLLSLAAWLLVGSESYFSWYQLSIDPAGPIFPTYNDWLNLAAACAFLILLALASGLARRELLVRFRLPGRRCGSDGSQSHGALPSLVREPGGTTRVARCGTVGNLLVLRHRHARDCPMARIRATRTSVARTAAKPARRNLGGRIRGWLALGSFRTRRTVRIRCPQAGTR